MRRLFSIKDNNTAYSQSGVQKPKLSYKDQRELAGVQAQLEAAFNRWDELEVKT